MTKPFPLENKLIPQDLLQQGYTRCFVYRGPSMRSTFRQGSLLYAKPATETLRRGDVIIFTDEDLQATVVHRIIAVTSEGYITRGDSNKQVDAKIVRSDQVIGRVALAGKETTLGHVPGGKKGLWYARARFSANKVRTGIKRILFSPYNWLRKNGWLAKVWHPRLLKIEIQTPHGVVVKYCLRKKTVATWDPLRREFHCVKPFDLVIRPPGE